MPTERATKDTSTSLSAREFEVLDMAARGMTNPEIAARLGLTVHAIKFHLASIYRKLGVGNRTEAAVAYTAVRPPRVSRFAAPLEAAVPFFNPRPMHEGLQEDLLADFARLIDSGAFINGPEVEAFELAMAQYVGTRYCVGVASGLDALRLGLHAAGLEPGEEVVVPAATFAATFEAVSQAGGVPVAADISDVDYGLDPDAAEAALTGRTRFLMPVHLYGQMADLERLSQLCVRRDLELIEDACQAHGATRDGVPAGSAGLAGAFSFYPAKNLGAMGDAGALTTDDEELAASVRSLREHGQRQKYRHEQAGYTARLDTIQAIVLLRKLPLLERWNDERRALALFYETALAGVGDLRLPQVVPGSVPVWHLYVVRTGDPAALAAFLQNRGIASGRHYPELPPLSPAYAYLGHSPGAFPVAEALAREGLSLPIFPGMTESQVERVAGAVASYFARP
jgi:dTDP-4-amino-4,6-dideoxygalactose transaminase/DNA-binding CsgD family transcriptional regulator